jgi:endonuclease/exonuclease/phosphatase family metal-dependent hydrolase
MVLAVYACVAFQFQTRGVIQLPRLRIATFNLESLDDRPGLLPSLSERVAALQPVLRRLDADVLCLQEVNAQEIAGCRTRRLSALDAVLAGTSYEHFHRATTENSEGKLSDVHNLVILSRWAIVDRRRLRHDLVSPPLYRAATALPKPERPDPVEWDRPLLQVAIALPGGRLLHVINLHLRAPLAAAVPGQKLAPFVWRTVGGWAEGFYMAAMKRAGQALEARLAVEALFDRDPDALIAIAGDLNAEARETPVRAIYGNIEDTGNPALADRALSLLENEVPRERRYSVVHHGLKLMLDHVLVSQALRRLHHHADILNDTLLDEYFAWLKGIQPRDSFHAPVVADFDLRTD